MVNTGDSRMKILSFRVISSLISFAIGVASAMVISYLYGGHAGIVYALEIPRADTPDLVATVRNTQPILTGWVKNNSNDDKTWRWLKDEIVRYQSSSEYLKESIPMPLGDGHVYQVSLQEMTGNNLGEELVFLRRRGVQLKPAHQYVWVWIMVDNITCPNWSGVIDISEPGLIFFEGSGG